MCLCVEFHIGDEWHTPGCLNWPKIFCTCCIQINMCVEKVPKMIFFFRVVFLPVQLNSTSWPWYQIKFHTTWNPFIHCRIHWAHLNVDPNCPTVQLNLLCWTKRNPQVFLQILHTVSEVKKYLHQLCGMCSTSINRANLGQCTLISAVCRRKESHPSKRN